MDEPSKPCPAPLGSRASPSHHPTIPRIYSGGPRQAPEATRRRLLDHPASPGMTPGPDPDRSRDTHHIPHPRPPVNNIWGLDGLFYGVPWAGFPGVVRGFLTLRGAPLRHGPPIHRRLRHSSMRMPGTLGQACRRPALGRRGTCRTPSSERSADAPSRLSQPQASSNLAWIQQP